jgi:hypothetical protein
MVMNQVKQQLFVMINGMKDKFESYNDYPEAVSNNAKRGIELNAKVNNGCATLVGKVRAQQLANKEKISVQTIKRMYSYLSRAEVYYNPDDTEACGTISYLLWGGLAGKRWAESKLKELNLFDMEKFRKISFDYDDTLTNVRIQQIARERIARGDDVYIVSARQNKLYMLPFAKRLGIPSDRVFATGSNNRKVYKIAALNIDTHYDNNKNVLDRLKTLGIRGLKV